MKKVICIVGPTGSGKTALSVKLAKSLGAEIINGDSVSIYKKLDIGSAKITPDEMDGVKHHLISHVALDEPYTVYNFQQDVRRLIDHIDRPFIVGGSGLYVKSSLYNYEFEQQDNIEFPNINEMIEVIRKTDPDVEIDLNNPRRIESAYRTIIHGQKRSDKTRKNEPLYDIYLIYLDLDRKILKKRLETRLDLMIEKGFIEETKSLINYDLNIIGYREIKEYLNGMTDLDTAKEKIITATMRFAKRQKTWFINQMKPKVYNALSPDLLDECLKDIKEFFGV
ncbi:tRNA (adenosine(37)-N6)-dimethylallyltransferase MiaA [Acholeplasma laidlawii]|uniref:tRNA (adenosine(37)-N6)-dimethylallyltransferase MiaA n=1 Tax=Acholeplasma laidlawii TaxID=2148 RepID=UPI003F925788